MKEWIAEIGLGLVALACVIGVVVLKADGHDAASLEIALATCIGALGGTALPKTRR